MFKLADELIEILEKAPGKYREAYSHIAGTIKIKNEDRKFGNIFVMDDGRYMVPSQPFLITDEDDWSPRFYVDESRLAKYLEKKYQEALELYRKRIVKEFAKPFGREIRCHGLFSLYQATKGEDWFIAVPSILPSEWFVDEDLGIFWLEWLTPGQAYHVGDTVETDKDGDFRILEIRSIKGLHPYPLIRVKPMS